MQYFCTFHPTTSLTTVRHPLFRFCRAIKRYAVLGTTWLIYSGVVLLMTLLVVAHKLQRERAPTRL